MYRGWATPSFKLPLVLFIKPPNTIIIYLSKLEGREGGHVDTVRAVINKKSVSQKAYYMSAAWWLVGRFMAWGMLQDDYYEQVTFSWPVRDQIE